MCRGALRVLACKPLISWLIHVATHLSTDQDDRSFAFQCLRSCFFDSSFTGDVDAAGRLVEQAIATGVVEVLLASLHNPLNKGSEGGVDIDVYNNRQCLLLARIAHPHLLCHLYHQLI